jgi:hypothetical protein
LYYLCYLHHFILKTGSAVAITKSGLKLVTKFGLPPYLERITVVIFGCVPKVADPTSNVVLLLPRGSDQVRKLLHNHRSLKFTAPQGLLKRNLFIHFNLVGALGYVPKHPVSSEYSKM